jgi:K+-transporting ATPase ATPase C chain
MRKDIITSAIGIVVLTLLLGIVYPLFITGVSQVAFPGNANGQKVYVDGKLVGSKIIGQNFGDIVYKKGKPVLDSDGNPVTTPDPHYFQTRPSGTDPADNAAGSAFANYGPNSVVTLAALKANIQTYIQLNGKYYPGGLTAARIPVDAADTSASAVDPEISIANADIQAYRIAAVRHLPLSTVHQLISNYTLGRGLGFSGEPGVDVLEINLALNRLSPSTS